MKLEMVGISIYGSLRGVARFPVSYVIGFPSWVCFHSIAGPSGLCNLSKLRRDSVGADFQSVRKLTNYIYAAPPKSRPKHFSNTLYKQSSAFYDFPIFAVKLLNYNGLKYHQKFIDWRDDPMFYKYWV